MACRQVSARKQRYSPKPPFLAESCAWQQRVGKDGKLYVSQPNDKGQYVWMLAPVPRSQRLKAVAREYGPWAAQKVAKAASRQLYQRLLPGHSYDNVLTVWEGPSYYDAYHA